MCKHCHPEHSGSHKHNHEHEHEHEHTCCDHHEHHEHNKHHDHHGHQHNDGCGCGHDHGHEPERDELTKLLIGAGLFVLGIALGFTPAPAWARIAVLAAAYLWLGGEVLFSAAKNIVGGHVFDENFLMSIATLGAFAIQEYPEAVGVMLFYRVGEYFEDKAVAQTRRQITEAVDMRPDVVNRLLSNDIDAKFETIPAEAAQVGDLLLVRPGDRIPLDGTITAGESRLDTSALTGEPRPVSVRPGSSVLSGALNTAALLTMRVDKPLADSMVTRILQSVENAAEGKPQIDRFITRFARVYTPIVVGLAVLVAAVPPLLFNGEFAYWLKTALTFLVISCPCALVLSVPLAYFAGIGAASRQGILFKSGLAMESVQRLKAVAFDKTGTLTHGNFAVQEIIIPDSAPNITPDITADELLALAAGLEATSTHPIAESIVNAAEAAGISYQRAQDVQELPGLGLSANVGGKQVFCGNRQLLAEQGVDISSCVSHPGATEVLLARDGQFIGQLVIADRIKDDTPAAIARLKAQGLSVCMLTGDSEPSAQAVAATAGVDEVHARLLPQDKLSTLTDIRARLGGVMFVGDGINDAPVLAGADIGAAMGSGSDAAIEAADVVFMNSNTAAVPQAIDIARAANHIAWQNIVFALGIKIAIMLVGLNGYANMWLAVFADTGVAMLCLLNSIRILYRK